MSVVVVTHDRVHSLPRVLAPLLSTGDALEVVVVVDGCADGTLELLRDLSHEDERVRPVWRENGGPSAARQTGVEAAHGDVVLLLDDDVVPDADLVRGHAARHAQDDALVVVGYMPTLLPAVRTRGQFATVLYAVEYEDACRRYEADPAHVLERLWTGNVSLRRADALRVGIDCPEVRGMYHEDTELGLRLAAAGLTGVFDRQLTSRHLHRRSLGAFARDSRAQGRGRVRLAALHPERVPEPSDADLLVGVPSPLVPMARRPTLAATCGLLRLVVVLSGFVRAYGVETVAARLLRRFEQVRGARAERYRVGQSGMLRSEQSGARPSA